MKNYWQVIIMKVTKRLIKDFKTLQANGPTDNIYVKDISESMGKPPFTEIRMMIVGPEGAHKNCLFFFHCNQHRFAPRKKTLGIRAFIQH